VGRLAQRGLRVRGFPARSSEETYGARADFGTRFDGFGARFDLELGRTRLDLGLAWREVFGDLTLAESGFLFDPSLPFTRETRGDLDLDQRELELDCGVRHELGPRAEVEVRYLREVEDEHGERGEACVFNPRPLRRPPITRTRPRSSAVPR
jgi:hypothetical protein